MASFLGWISLEQTAAVCLRHFAFRKLGGILNDVETETIYSGALLGKFAQNNTLKRN